MRFSIQVELTDDEVLKYAEDVGRRWTLNAIHDTLRHLRGIDPNLFRIAGEIFAAAVVGSTPPSAPPITSDTPPQENAPQPPEPQPDAGFSA